MMMKEMVVLVLMSDISELLMRKMLKMAKGLDLRLLCHYWQMCIVWLEDDKILFWTEHMGWFSRFQKNSAMVLRCLADYETFLRWYKYKLFA